MVSKVDVIAKLEMISKNRVETKLYYIHYITLTFFATHRSVQQECGFNIKRLFQYQGGERT